MRSLSVAMLVWWVSWEREISLRSWAYVAQQLQRAWYTVTTIEQDGSWVRERTDLDSFDCIFPVVHGEWWEDGQIAARANQIWVPRVWCDAQSSYLCYDKLLCKQRCEHWWVAVAPYAILRSNHLPTWSWVQQWLWDHVFVKALNQWSSQWVWSVRSESDYNSAIEWVFAYWPMALIEKAIHWREIEVAVAWSWDGQTISVPWEIITWTDGWYSHEEKYATQSTAQTVVWAELTTAQHEYLRTLTKTIWQILWCAGMRRCDYFLDKQWEFIFNEINTIPGFTSISLYPKLLKASWIPPIELMHALINWAMDR